MLAIVVHSIDPIDPSCSSSLHPPSFDTSALVQDRNLSGIYRWLCSRLCPSSNKKRREEVDNIFYILMLIVSWNVAGLKPALQRIHSDYGGSGSGSSSSTSTSAVSSSGSAEGLATTKSSKNNIDPFANYLRLHGDIDILCLQEHKIPYTQLSSRSEPHRCSSIEGYESFWSCVSGNQKSGFNGVVTYVKVGLVQSANCTPLNDPELDNQGRCVMTDHGKFVVFNVYVPCGGGSQTLPKKMKFLYALSNAMKKQREGEGKHVILVGDMNLKVDKRDVPWGSRSLNVDDVLMKMKMKKDDSEKKECGEEQFPKWKKDLANHWDRIEQVLQTKEVRKKKNMSLFTSSIYIYQIISQSYTLFYMSQAMPRQTTNPSTKETFDRFRTRVKVGENKYAMLGSYEDTAEEALCYYTFDEQSYVDPANNEITIYRRKNLLCVDTLVELMSKIGNVTWNEKTQREIANSEEVGLNPDNPPYLWMKALLDGEEGMVDVFRHFYPTAEERFTVWHQFMQKRYTNEGTRIDFTLVDKSLMSHVEPNDGKTLRCGKEPHSNPLGEEAALSAATAGGLFEPGSFSGGGIAVATKRALDTQFGETHTGMIYTPPSYSDHIAVSLLMKSSFKEFVGEVTLANDASTRKAQPHKKQRSISSFFSSASSKSSSTVPASKSTTSAGAKRSATTQDSKPAAKKKSLHSYFDGSAKTKENGTSTTTNTSSSSSTSTKRSGASQENDEKKRKALYSFFGKSKTKADDGDTSRSTKEDSNQESFDC